MKVITIVALGFLIIIFGTDFVFYLKNRYCRYHIGRKTGKAWEEAVIKKARQWSKHIPTVQVKDNAKYMLWELLSSNNRDASVQAFQSASLYLGLQDIGDKPDIHFDHPKKPDYAMLAYALLRQTEDPSIIKKQMDEAYIMLKNATDKNGLIAYTGNPEDNARYVDILGMVCPFLARYSSVYNVPEAAELAFRQLKFYHNNGLLYGTSLPNHAIDAKSKLPLGVYGWGRGTAWYVIGLTDTYNELNDAAKKSEIMAWMREAAECYKNFQNEDGGFCSILQRKRHYDSSATSVFAWFYFKCNLVFEENEYYIIANKALEKIRKTTRISGAIDYSQGDTKDIGVFSEVYDTMPFTQGFAIRAIVLAD